MKKTPKSLRLHIGLFGRTNVGKSSLLNMIAGQDKAITSPHPGTTTDTVEKAMELLPLGPVVFIDTAGLDDKSVLGKQRVKRTKKIFDVSDIILIVTEPNIWTEYETNVINEAQKRKIPFIIVVNKTDIAEPSEDFIKLLKTKTDKYEFVSGININKRDEYVSALKKRFIQTVPDDFLNPPPLVGDLLTPGGLVYLIVPIDLQAPKGRLILPQVQTIRDALDSDAASIVVKEREYSHLIKTLNIKPNLAVCDSQVVLKMTADTPKDVKCTTFSILFSRSKGDLIESAKGAAAIPKLKHGDKILIAEACTHHPLEDDIGRVKIPRWLKQYAGCNIEADVCAGIDYPENLSQYKLIIHCGGCMINRRNMLSRIQQAKEAGVPITNYGVAISFVQGVLERVLSPFPAALDAYKTEISLK